MNADPVDSAALAFFRKPDGRRLLDAAMRALDASQPLTVQERLRTEFPASMCRAALATIELRSRAQEKFSRATQMFFDREGLEMATREEVASYRAQRFSRCDTVLDLCCGIGGDTLALATQSRVIAVDENHLRLEMARMNGAAMGIDADRILFACADAAVFSARADAAFVDPARRQSGQRVRAVEAYHPPLSSLEELRRRIPLVAVKMAPGIRTQELPTDAEVEFISSAGQCREALVSFKPLARVRRRATVLPGPHCLEEDAANSAVADADAPGAYLHDPDPSVVRAGLVDRLATHLDAWKLDQGMAYLTSDTGTVSPFAQLFRVLWDIPFNLKNLKQRLSHYGMRAEEIKKRHFPIEPEEMRRLLGVKPRRRSVDDSLRAVTLVLTRIAQRPHAFVCERVTD